MAIPNSSKRELPPTHPGEMLREDFMPDFDLSTSSLAAALGVSRQTINEIFRERRAITPAYCVEVITVFRQFPRILA